MLNESHRNTIYTGIFTHIILFNNILDNVKINFKWTDSVQKVRIADNIFYDGMCVSSNIFFKVTFLYSNGVQRVPI